MRPMFSRRLIACLMGLVVLWLGALPVFAQGTDSLLPVTEAYKLSTDASTPGVLKLHWTIAPDYYLYRGRMRFKAGDGVTLGEAQLPDGEKHHDEYLGDVETYHHAIDATLAYTVAAGTARLKLSVQYQGCHEVDPKICYPPHTEQLDLPLPAGVATTTAATGATAPDHATGSLSAALRAIGNQPPSGANAVSPPPSAVAQPAPEPPPAGIAQAPLSLVAALLLALGGGLVLNLMPCVLPVLSIKAVSVLESGESASRARRHALYYSAGVLCSFAALGLGILALRSAGHALGWGTQLQQPIVVGVLALVMLAVGLSMSGVVQFGASLGNTGATLASRSGPAGDFFTGVLAVVVASPCTAPFMGSALAYAFAAPMLSALLVFLMLGVGLALPFLLIGFVPALARLLPRPGRWMETLKQVLAFPMYLTAVWLVWVLAHQRGADAVGLVLVAMVLLAMTLWWFERSRHRGTISRVLVGVLALATLVPVYLLAQVQRVASVAAAEDGVATYSPEKLAALRAAGTPVFVDMTADWCVTCKANEHTVLDTKAFRDLLQRTGAVYMKGDWTDVNPTISTFLQLYHSPGVPLYVVFPKHGGAGQQLSTVLTPTLVEQALTAAAQ
ncbi:protein-disulfide reductase DsbD [Rhodanobacter sp. MP7CTX1]|uniref:protein-disulfide reductase DsbD family protein n=1 Tax=Rhodanobacter sp. MP7CTX1 TaxID=2723084 RepID=UPI001609051E|nr:protein-disulfide reductase DsbD [Rhodanobacter sp. MP7CTX1]MBB6186628.1 thiol:disulfide interchange protein DsbD [Rhodanobacter sp. MP7CTX1]